MNAKIQKIIDTLNNFNITISSQKTEQFEAFASIITEVNKSMNLMSSNDVNLIYEKHFVDSLAFAKYISPKKEYDIIDIGSGGGFPVIPIAIILDKSKIISVDSTGKKVDFLNMSAKKIGLNNFLSIKDRAENLAFKKSYRENFDFATARAVGNLSQISELCIPYLKIGGKFLAYKSTKVDEEIKQAENAINILGGKISDVYNYTLELQENFTRNIVVIEKISPTPTEYPRSFSVIKNKAL